MSANLKVLRKEEYCKPITSEMVESIPGEVLLHLYKMMLKIRLVEEKIADLVAKREIICPCHLSIGQEAVAAGVCAALEKEDFVYSTHRNHAHYLAKGGSIKPMLAELYGRASGCSSGRGGSMHLVAGEIGFPGASAIVGGTIPHAVGSALAYSLQRNGQVAVAFFGDGATDEGVFYESLNFAALRKLPVVFVCENNFYSTHMHISTRHANVDIYKKAEVFNLSALRIDGYNVIEVLLKQLITGGADNFSCRGVCQYTSARGIISRNPQRGSGDDFFVQFPRFPDTPFQKFSLCNILA